MFDPQRSVSTDYNDPNPPKTVPSFATSGGPTQPALKNIQSAEREVYANMGMSDKQSQSPIDLQLKDLRKQKSAISSIVRGKSTEIDEFLKGSGSGLAYQDGNNITHPFVFDEEKGTFVEDPGKFAFTEMGQKLALLESQSRKKSGFLGMGESTSEAVAASEELRKLNSPQGYVHAMKQKMRRMLEEKHQAESIYSQIEIQEGSLNTQKLGLQLQTPNEAATSVTPMEVLDAPRMPEIGSPEWHDKVNQHGGVVRSAETQSPAGGEYYDSPDNVPPSKEGMYRFVEGQSDGRVRVQDIPMEEATSFVGSTIDEIRKKRDKVEAMLAKAPDKASGRVNLEKKADQLSQSESDAIDSAAANFYQNRSLDRIGSEDASEWKQILDLSERESSLKSLDRDRMTDRAITGVQKELDWLTSEIAERKKGLNDYQLQRLDDIIRNPTGWERSKFIAKRAAAAAGTTFVDVAEFLHRNAMRIAPIVEYDADSKSVEFMHAMKDVAAEWGMSSQPDEVTEKLMKQSFMGITAEGFGSGVGSMAAFLAPGILVGRIGQAANLSTKAIQRLSMLSTGTVGSAAMGNSLREEVLKTNSAAIEYLGNLLSKGEINQNEHDQFVGKIKSVEGKQAAMAEVIGVGLGATELLPLSSMLGKTSKLTAGRLFSQELVEKIATGKAKSWLAGSKAMSLAKRILGVGQEATEDALQEYYQTIGQNLAASGDLGNIPWDADRDALEGAFEGAGVGAVSSGLLATLISASSPHGKSEIKKAYEDAGQRLGESIRNAEKFTPLTPEDRQETENGADLKSDAIPVNTQSEPHTDQNGADLDSMPESPISVFTAKGKDADGKTVNFSGRAADMADIIAQAKNQGVALDPRTIREQESTDNEKPTAIDTDATTQEVESRQSDSSDDNDGTGSDANPVGNSQSGSESTPELKQPPRLSSITDRLTSDKAKSNAKDAHRARVLKYVENVMSADVEPVSEVLTEHPDVDSSVKVAKAYKLRGTSVKPIADIFKTVQDFSSDMEVETTIEILSGSDFAKKAGEKLATRSALNRIENGKLVISFNADANGMDSEYDVIATATHESLHSVGQVMDPFIKDEWDKLTPKQRRKAADEYGTGLKELSDEELTGSYAARQEWFAFQGFRVLKGESTLDNVAKNYGQKFAQKLGEFIKQFKEVLRKWAGSADVSTERLDQFISEVLGRYAPGNYTEDSDTVDVKESLTSQTEKDDSAHLKAAKKKPTPNQPKKQLASTQVTLPSEAAKPFMDYAKSIKEDDIYTKDGDYGIEEEPHVTALFGLTSNDAKQVRDTLKGEGPISIQLGETSLFENDDFDVLKVSAKSPDLKRINKKLSVLDNENSFPDYKPHLTIAYLKKGEGKKYAGDKRFKGQEIVFDALTFSGFKDAKGKRKIEEIPLSPKAPTAKPSNLSGAEKELGDALDGLFAPEEGVKQKGIPSAQLPTLLPIVEKLIAEGKNTPADVVATLDKIAESKGKPKAARVLADALYSIFRMSDPSLPQASNWNAVFNEIDTPTAEDSSVDQKAKTGGPGMMGFVEVELVIGNKLTRNDLKKNADTFRLTEKEADEWAEAGVVSAARKIIADSKRDGLSEQEIYAKLVDLNERQPNLTAKTSESKIQQAYSTPIPFAYVASRLAGVNSETRVLEPTAGHGALLIEANPELAYANELNDGRRERLEAVGSAEAIFGNDATKKMTSNKAFDVLIANPPFGVIKKSDGTSETWTMPHGGETTNIDYQIIMQQLEALKDDGRAVFLYGGLNKQMDGNGEAREEAYGKGQRKQFLDTLYANYNVIDYFTVSGDLYRKQGAGWPIDVIVVAGRGKAKTELPYAKNPRILNSWDDLRNELNKTDQQRIESRKLSEADIRDIVSDGVAGIEGAVAERPQFGVRDGERSSGVRSESTRRSSNESSDPGANKPVSRTNQSGSNANASNDSKSGSARVGISGTQKQSEQQRSIEPSGRTAFHEKYQPASKHGGFDTLIPKNMAGAAREALSVIEKETGKPVDEFVREKLGYAKDEDLTQYFAAEQMDALAMAVYQSENGAALVEGDQTGIGKGRVAAGMIRYAVTQGKIPIFITKEPKLYKAMIEDLADIGTSNIIPTFTNNSLTFQDHTKKKWSTGSMKEIMEGIAESRQLPGEVNALFTTYDQIKSDVPKGLDSASRKRFRASKTAPPDGSRMRAIKALVATKKAVLVMDEAHLASGDSIVGWRMSPLVMQADSVLYLSATFAKRPDSMGIYMRTDINKASGGNADSLVSAMTSGGVPLQQAVSGMLTQAGQYIRRERDFDGVVFETKISQDTATRDLAVADAYIGGLREIYVVNLKIRDAVSSLNKMLKRQAKSINATAPQIESSNFSAKIHNMVSQYLLAIKSKAAAQEAVKAIREGVVTADGSKKRHKVIVAVQNTMQGPIEEIQAAGYDLNFKGLLQHYLEQQRHLKQGSGPDATEIYISNSGDPKFEQMDDRQLVRMMIVPAATEEDPKATTINQEVVDEYFRRIASRLFQEAEAHIDEIDIGDMPLSPIDAMRYEVEKAGIRTGEITGRSIRLDADGEMVNRSASERSKAGQLEVMNEFNDSDMDFIILNASGSTGISLHASEKFKRQDPRMMIVVQPHLDINEFMQTLGRIHRSGQVEKPYFMLLQTAIPAELRPAAILGKKMASLNANTTSNADSDVSEANDSVDIFNVFGDEIVHRILQGDPELVRMLGYEEKLIDQTGNVIGFDDAKSALMVEDGGDYGRKVTGRLAIASIEEQRAFWEKAIEDYASHMAYLNEMGENTLIAEELDIKADVIEKTVFTTGGDSGSVFDGPSYQERVSVEMGEQPPSGEEVIAMSRKAQSKYSELFEQYETKIDAFYEKARADAESKSLNWEKRKDSWERTNRERMQTMLSAIRHIGGLVRIGESTYGAVVDFKIDDDLLLTPSKHTLIIQTNSGKGSVKMPFSMAEERLTTVYPGGFAQLYDSTMDWSSERIIVTGNLLAAYSALSNKGMTTGKIVTYTTKQGSIETGILLPAAAAKQLKEQQEGRVFVKSSKEFAEALRDSTNKVANTEDTIQVVIENGNYSLKVPASKRFGGKYWQDPTLNKLTSDGLFRQVGDKMVAAIPASKLEALFIKLNEMGESLFYLKANTDTRQGLAAPEVQETLTKRELNRDKLYAKAVEGRKTAMVNTLFNQAAKEAAVEYPVSGYKNVGDQLMGFTGDSKPNTPYSESGYKKEITVVVKIEGGKPFVDGMKGLNIPHAMERARRNWEGANILFAGDTPATSVAYDEAGKLIPLSTRFRKPVGTMREGVQQGQPLFAPEVKGTPEQEAIRKRTNTDMVDRRTIAEKLQDYFRGTTESLKSRFIQGTIDNFEGARRAADATLGTRFSEEADATVSPWKAFHATRQTRQVFDAWTTVGTFGIKRDGGIYLKKGSRGLSEILSPLNSQKGDLTPLWEAYVTAKRAEELIEQGREKNFGFDREGYSKALANGEDVSREDFWSEERARTEIAEQLKLAEQFPVFEEVRKSYVQWNHDLLNFAEEAGIIDPIKRADWESDVYVPFNRVDESDAIARLIKENPPKTAKDAAKLIRRLKGGDGRVAVMESIIGNFQSMMQESLNNIAKRKLVTAIGSNGLFVEKAKHVPIPFKVAKSEVIETLARKRFLELQATEELPPKVYGDIKKFTDMAKSQAAAGRYDLIGIADEAELEKQITFWRMQRPQGDDIMTVMVGGKPQYWKVKDKMLMESILAIGPDQWQSSLKPFLAPFNASKKLLTDAITLEPGFIIANTSRESMIAWMTNQEIMVPGVQGMTEAAKLLTNDTLAAELKGVGFGSVSWGGFRNNPMMSKNARKEIFRMERNKRRGFLRSIIGSPGDAFRAYERLVSVSENANRYAVARKILDRGGSLQEAAFQANDQTNFSAHGGAEIMRILVHVSPFLNSALQGMYRTMRQAGGLSSVEGRRQMISFATKAAVLSGATLALLGLNWDNDEYWELPDWDRNAYWHIFVGGQHFRIPKPFEVGAMFATVPERMWIALRDKEPNKKASAQLGEVLKTAFPSLPVPQIAKQAIEVKFNTNFYTGLPIEGLGDKFQAPEDRFNAYSSETFIEMADRMPDSAPEWMRSPKMLEHTYRGLTGTLGTYVMDMADIVTRRAANYPNAPKTHWRDAPIAKNVIGRYWRSPDKKSSGYVSEFYDLLKQSETYLQSMERHIAKGRIEKAQKVQSENAKIIAASSMLRSTQKELSQLKKRREQVFLSPAMSPELKQQQIQEITKRRNELSKRAVRSVFPMPN